MINIFALLMQIITSTVYIDCSAFVVRLFNETNTFTRRL